MKFKLRKSRTLTESHVIRTEDIIRKSKLEIASYKEITVKPFVRMMEALINGEGDQWSDQRRNMIKIPEKIVRFLETAKTYGSYSNKDHLLTIYTDCKGYLESRVRFTQTSMTLIEKIIIATKWIKDYMDERQEMVILKLPPSSITCRLGTVMELRTFGMDAKEERTSNILKISVDDVSSINNELVSLSELSNSILTITQQVVTNSKKIDESGGDLISTSDSRAKICIPAKCFNNEHTIHMQVERLTKVQAKKLKPKQLNKKHLRSVGPMCTIDLPEVDKSFKMFIPPPELDEKEDLANYLKNIKLLVNDGTEWNTEDTNCDVNALGEAAAEIINIETVTFFFSHKKDMLFVECCLKENLEKEIAAVQKRGFCSHSAPSPDFLLKTINGRAEINVSVTGDLNLRGGDVMIVFEKNLDTARHSDFLDGRVQPSSKMCGYVRFSITPEYMAQCLESNKDGYFSVMPITIVNRNQAEEKLVWWDTEIAKAAEIMKKEAVVLDNLPSLFRDVLKLDDGTIYDISHRHERRVKDILDAGITEWQRYEDFQETIDFWRKKEGEFDEIRSEIGSSEDEVDGFGRYQDFKEMTDFGRQNEGKFDEIRSEIGSDEDEVGGVSVSEVDDSSIEEDIQHYEPSEIELVASISTTKIRSLPLAIPRRMEEMSSSSDKSNVRHLNRSLSSEEGKNNLEYEKEPESETESFTFSSESESDGTYSHNTSYSSDFSASDNDFVTESEENG
ncbi:hypothetical protein LSH36_264g00040 [Paralvinella palmiformis]|uniref:Uncharacterized protein n=1 Tax=Paralvinella palmiformis TaxID=53620 RepID=A0AAD9N4C6_9ANNE|nr:hypothetical protein LSH36_264g00040 [Paralvinella palmiformis]